MKKFSAGGEVFGVCVGGFVGGEAAEGYEVVEGLELGWDFEGREGFELFFGDGGIGVSEGGVWEFWGLEEGGEVGEGDGVFIEVGEGGFGEAGFGVSEDGVEGAVLFWGGVGLEGIDELGGEDFGGLGGDFGGGE